MKKILAFIQTILPATWLKKLAPGQRMLLEVTLGVFVFLVGPIVLFNIWSPQKTQAAWFDDNWAFRKAITLTDTAAETNKYATLSSYDASDTTRYQSDCGDVRFTDASGKLLKYTVSSCGATTTFRINIDSILNGTQTIYIYYGNSSVSNGFLFSDPYTACATCSFGAPATEEKGPGPVAYWKFDEGYGATAHDSTAQAADGVIRLPINTGTGADGDKTVSGLDNTSFSYFQVNALSSSGQAQLNLASTTGLAVNNEIFIIQVTGTGQGNYETCIITTVNASNVICNSNLTNSYQATGAQAVKMPQWRNVTINSGGTLTTSAWNGTTRGVIAFRASGTLTVSSGGTISLNGLGFSGGAFASGGTGGGIQTTGGTASAGNVGSGPGPGGGGGVGGNPGVGGATTAGGGAGGTGGGGGGGGYGTAGNAGGTATSGTGGAGAFGGAAGGTGSAGSGGNAGSSVGAASLSSIYLGSGGGSGASGAGGGGGESFGGGDGGASGAGGGGGGILFVGAETITISGSITNSGVDGESGGSGLAGVDSVEVNVRCGGGGAPGAPGGGGSGGSILLQGKTNVTVGASLVTASAGAGGTNSGITGGRGGNCNLASGGAPSSGAGGGGSSDADNANGGDAVGGAAGIGGAGSAGRIHIDYGSSTSGTTSPSADSTLTASSWQSDDQCIYGKCLYFNGTSSKVTVASTIRNVQSAAFWVRPNTLNTTNALIDLDGGTHKITANSSGSLTATGFTSPTIYVNGVVSSTITKDKWNYVEVTTGTSFNANSSFTIATDGTNYTKGFFDEVKIYNYARSAAQAQTDYAARGNKQGANAVLGIKDPKYLSEGLVGYWKEDETTNGATAVDSSGNGASLTDTATVIRTGGKSGNGGDFESGSSKYQSAADNATLSLTGNLTLSAWIKPESVAAGSYNIIAKWDGANESYRLFQNGDEIRLELNSSGNYQETTASNLTASAWYHVVGVYNASLATAKIYIDGIEAASTTTGTIPSSIGDDAGKFHIGAEDSTTTAANFYDGIIDEARVYNRGLSSLEVQNLYNFSSGPVGYWKLDEGSGTSAQDSSVNANTGMLTNTPLWTLGKFGKALNFNGTNQYVTLSGDPAAEKITGGLSISAWVNLRTNNAVHDIVAKKGASGNFGYRLSTTAAGALQFEVSGTGSDTFAATGSSTLNNSTWYHVVGTYAPVSVGLSTLKVYVNGVQDGSSTTGVPRSLFNSTSNVNIGAENTGASNFMSGTIDEVKVYSYDRLAKQVVEDMNAGHPAGGSPVGSQVAYWKMDEGYSTTANNSGNAGSAVNGTLTNMSTTGITTSGWTLNAKVGKALAFDGSNDYVTTTSDPSALKITSDLSISAWVNLRTNNAVHDIVAKKGASGNFGYRLSTTAAGALQFEVSGTGSDTFAATSSSTLNNSTWYHVVGTYAPVSVGLSTLKVYVNGVQEGSSTTGVPRSIFNSTSNVNIGAENTGASNFVSGSIDEVKIYSGLLTDSEIKIDFNKGSAKVLGSLSDTSGLTGGTVASSSASAEYCIPGDTSTCSAPIDRWNFEEGSGQTLNDTSGNGNNGTLGSTSSTDVNDPSWTTGKFGRSLNFENNVGATSANNDYVDFGDITSWDGLNSFTAEAWLYIDNLPTGLNNASIVRKDGTFTPMQIGGPDSGFAGMKVNIWIDASLNAINDNDLANWTTGVWHHFAATWTSGDKVKFYRDGVNYFNSGSAITGSISNSANNLRFGATEHATPQEGYDGKLDDVRIYNYARTPAQVAWDYNRGAPTMHLKADECQGTTLNDSSGNSLSGTLYLEGTAAGTCATSLTPWGNGVTGKFNYSFDFDGSNDVATVSANTKINFSDNLVNGFTISNWVKADSGGEGNTGQIYQKGTNNYLRVDNPSGSNLDVEANLDLATTDANVNVSSGITTSGFNHIVETWDGTTLKVYINGLQRGSGTGSGAIVSDANNLLIGGAATANFDGRIDDFRIYNYAMISSQVKMLYNQGGGVRYGPSSGAP